MTTVVIALVSFAVAFVAGGLLSKVYFTVHGADDSAATKTELTEQRRRYRKRIDALQRVIKRHEDAQAQLKAKLTRYHKATAKHSLNPIPPSDDLTDLQEAAQELRAQLAIRDKEVGTLRERIAPLAESRDVERQKLDSSQNELSLLRIERDELLARIQRLETTPKADAGQAVSPNHAQTDVAASLREEMGEMRENLAKRDRQVHDLELQLKEGDNRNVELQARLESWKQRVSPLTKKLKQQSRLIRDYRERQSTPAFEPDRPAGASPGSGDNLKKIRGIGPALERRLHRHGIRSFEQIAGLSERELVEIAEQLAIAPNLAQRDRWIEQARELAEGQTALA